MKQPIPILFTIPNFITAGSGRAMLNICARLDPSRFAPAVAVLQKGGTLDAEVEARGWPLYEIPFAFPARPRWKLPWRAWRASRRLPFRRYRIWHSFHYADDYTEAVVARLAGASAWIFTKKNMSWGGRAWRLRARLAARIVAQNQDMQTRYFDEPRLRKKTVLIPRGVDTERFHPGVEPRLDLRRRHGLAKDEPLFGMVGGLLALKGHDAAIRALVHLPRGTLLIAGSGVEGEPGRALAALVSELGLRGRVRFLGPVSDVPAFLAELDVFIHPTRSSGEGCPVAVLEALASGRATVITDVPGSRDLVEDHVNGRVVPPDAPEALAEALRSLVAEPARRVELGDAARRRILVGYDVDREAAAHAALYEEVVQGD